MESIKSHKQLRVYQAARAAAAKIFRLSLRFPPEEKYEMRNQIRRCSRSPCATLGEVWRHRYYPAAFTSKLIEAEGEAAEVQVWLDLALDAEYITKAEHDESEAEYESIIAQFVKMRLTSKSWAALRPRAPKR